VALHHPGPSVRRDFLFFLDHYANDVSATVFAEALQGPVDTVRNAALHSIACESCRTGELCVNEVVPVISDVLARDRRAWEALKRAAEHDPDGTVRQAAAEALQGSYFAPPKRRDRHQRRHDRTGRGPRREKSARPT
jgi:hypothetical protein